MSIEIRNRWSGAVIYTHAVDGATMRQAVEAAQAAVANLRGADLSDADLSDADLSDADLSGANLSGADLSGADLSGADLSGANLRVADLSDADLRVADLSDADLSDADLSGANLRGADLSGADLRDADLLPVRDDIWAVLSSAPREVPALIDALKAGRVDGSTYEGECSCLVGTIGKASGKGIYGYETLAPNSSRPAERFFMGIKRGDTPETSQFSALALHWAQQWLDTMRAAFAPVGSEP